MILSLSGLTRSKLLITLIALMRGPSRWVSLSLIDSSNGSTKYGIIRTLANCWAGLSSFGSLSSGALLLLALREYLSIGSIAAFTIGRSLTATYMVVEGGQEELSSDTKTTAWLTTRTRHHLPRLERICGVHDAT